MGPKGTWAKKGKKRVGAGVLENKRTRDFELKHCAKKEIEKVFRKSYVTGEGARGEYTVLGPVIIGREEKYLLGRARKS